MVKEQGQSHMPSNPTAEASDHGPETWGAAVFSDKGLFLLLLYDKAIGCMQEALELLDAGDMVAKSDQLIRAQDIVTELSDALDRNTGAIAFNLERLYLYIYRRLIRGNVHMDRDAIIEARTLMEELYDAWQAIILGRDSTVPISGAAATRFDDGATWRMRA